MADIKFTSDPSAFEDFKSAAVAFQRGQIKVEGGRHHEPEAIYAALRAAVGGEGEAAGGSGPEEAGSAQGASESVSYEDMNNEDLRDLLSERDLPTSGKKAELVARLEADDAGETAPDDEDDFDDFGEDE